MRGGEAFLLERGAGGDAARGDLVGEAGGERLGAGRAPGGAPVARHHRPGCRVDAIGLCTLLMPARALHGPCRGGARAAMLESRLRRKTQGLIRT